ncbi:hypothetical protein DOTSEDRAFT_74011 [Dothistroma septosporum NZE10]|uniref:Uncharacterized protein n=1 Tax=Dothistroma septosporum (strain NZE10 / CBS 128990) TaxID=675120 RepID=N1PGR3_DOTSN|nr:hypothetical protein DOTSEDRAFT_74011 [Dothistroma septosporum NZE10]
MTMIDSRRHPDLLPRRPASSPGARDGAGRYCVLFEPEGGAIHGNARLRSLSRMGRVTWRRFPQSCAVPQEITVNQGAAVYAVGPLCQVVRTGFNLDASRRQ